MAGRKPLPDDQRKVERKVYLPAATWARVDQLATLFGVDRVEAHRRIAEIGIECAERRESRKAARGVRG